MYGLRLTLRASAALTFRVMPSGMLDIITYPFVPPTTFSGWLRRVWMLARGLDLPETAVKNAPYYVLPPELLSMGAYPARPSHVHKTKRKGVKDFANTNLSRLASSKNDKTLPEIQLHSWEYLTADALHGYLLSENEALLGDLRSALLDGAESVPWGCKLGKEGFAFLEAVDDVQLLRRRQGEFEARTLIPLDMLVSHAPPVDFAVYNVYRHVWANGTDQHDLAAPSNVLGYDLLPMGYAPASGPLHLSGTWWTADTWQIPHGLDASLRGQR